VSHVRHVGNIPVADILIEDHALIEHAIHGGDTRYLPVRYILVETSTAVEHVPHDATNVPSRNVLVEADTATKRP